MRNFIAFSLLVFASLSYGKGATSSGGGNSANNSSNPWFLENTKTVNYCVAIDESQFGSNRLASEQAIEKAFGFWKNSFSKAKLNMNDGLEPYGGAVRLATQTFQLGDCNEHTDIKFNLGTLDSTELSLVGDPREYIGLAMRTSYDEENLKGKGFIYLGPSFGAWRPDSHDFDANPWAHFDGLMLQLVLAHEIGHIFGLDHNEIRGDLLSAVFPAMITQTKTIESIYRNKDNLIKFIKARHIEKPYFHFEEKNFILAPVCLEGCEEARAFFHLQGNERYLKIVDDRTDEVSSPKYTFYAGEGLDRWTKIGENCTKATGTGNLESAASVYINNKQKVFTKLPSSSHFDNVLDTYLYMTEYEYATNYCSSRASTEPAIVLRGDRRFKFIDVVMNNFVETEYLWNQEFLWYGIPLSDD